MKANKIETEGSSKRSQPVITGYQNGLYDPEEAAAASASFSIITYSYTSRGGGPPAFSPTPPQL